MWIALDLEPARHIVVDDEENKTLENQCWSLATQVETENSAHQSQPAGVVSWIFLPIIIIISIANLSNQK